MNKLFKGQISFQAVFSKCARARYYHGILAATDLDNQGPFLGNEGQTPETTETKEPLPPPILPSAKIPSGWSL